MVSELESMGTKLMVSVWPSLSPLSSNYKPMLERGLLVSNEQGAAVHSNWPERGVSAWIGVAFYDPTSAEARKYIWDQVEKSYYEAGVRVFWLDACEPEMRPYHPAGLAVRRRPRA